MFNSLVWSLPHAISVASEFSCKMTGPRYHVGKQTDLAHTSAWEGREERKGRECMTGLHH